MTTHSTSSSDALVPAALAAIKIGTWEYDVSLNRLRCDSTMAALYGLSPSECRVGIPIEAVSARIHVDDRERGIAKRVQMSKQGGLFVIEYRTNPAFGAVCWVLVRGCYEPDDSGHGMRGRGIVLDITEMKQDGYAEGQAFFVTRDRDLSPAPVGLQAFQGRNQLLRLLPADCWAELGPKLEPVTMPQGMVVCEPNETCSHAYFPEEGICSVITCASTDIEVEAGMFGREGFGPANIGLGALQAPQRVIVQIKGHGHRIPARLLAQAVDRLPTLRRLMSLYAQTSAVQTAFTALSHATQPIDRRLARWLLMCHDRVDGDDIHLTHEFLAVMLSVRRPGVTVALHMLEGERLIRSRRGVVTVRDRQGLERFAGQAYGRSEAEHRRLIGPFGRN